MDSDTAWSESAPQESSESTVFTNYLSPDSYPEVKLFDCSEKLELYTCIFCGLSTHLLVDLHTHITIAHKFKSIQQNHCQYHYCEKTNFNTFSLLVWLKHCSTCFMCQCKKKTSNHRKKQEDSVSSHILIQHNESDAKIEWYKCNLCPYKGKLKDYLRKHMVSMHKDKLFDCDQCEFQATSKFCLKSHKMEKHTLDKNYKCNFCSFSAKWLIHLKRHELEKHAAPEEIQWFQCEHCDFRAKRKDNLKQHVRARHVEVDEWFQCKKCEFRTKWKRNFKLHKEKLKHGV